MSTTQLTITKIMNELRSPFNKKQTAEHLVSEIDYSSVVSMRDLRKNVADKRTEILDFNSREIVDALNIIDASLFRAIMTSLYKEQFPGEEIPAWTAAA